MERMNAEHSPALKPSASGRGCVLFFAQKTSTHIWQHHIRKPMPPDRAFSPLTAQIFLALHKVAPQKICLSGTKNLLPVALREKARWSPSGLFSLLSYAVLPFVSACILINQRLLNCGARRAALRPYFLRSFILGSRVRKPAALRAARNSGLTPSRARATP